ncbi:hypothetical protein ACFFX0_32550 [Citricoccus parietis]|uniref:Uncharacterized protein n=1 Tax=Citricoccus parietis TaxID=592307 RepID=A0ABV5G9L3_9MICC
MGSTSFWSAALAGAFGLLTYRIAVRSVEVRCSYTMSGFPAGPGNGPWCPAS